MSGKMVAVTVQIPAAWVPLLEVLGEPAEVLAELADHAQQGVYRPGSWERPWLVQAFGDDFTAKLERDPEVAWRERPRKG